MSAEQVQRFSAVLAGSDGSDGLTLALLCVRALEILPAEGCAIVLMSEDRGQGLAGASDGTASAGQDLEFTLGQGPGIEAYSGGVTVLAEDLDGDGRWPQFSSPASNLGIRSVCALPLQVGSIRLGVLSLYGTRPRALDARQLSEAHLVAALVTHLVIGLQSNTASESLAFGLEISDYRAVVHQATGMISAQLGCDPEEALVRLRGFSYGEGRSIEEVSTDVVARSIRFDDG
ncbi:MAG: GAF and ANTAR domain-containing protein [Acidimicrobiales bacterium]